MFTLVDLGTNNRYVIPAKSADESTIRLLLAVCEKEPLTVYTDGFRAYDPLNEDNAFDREYVVHGGGEYAANDVHVNTCESHSRSSDPWLSPHRSISKDKLIPPNRSTSTETTAETGKRSAQRCYQSHAVKSAKC